MAEEQELVTPSFDILYTVEITDLLDSSKSRFTPEQLFGFQETKRTMTWMKNILYPSRYFFKTQYDPIEPENNEYFVSDRGYYLDDTHSNATEVTDPTDLFLYNADTSKNKFYAYFFDITVMCIYQLCVKEDKSIETKVYRRLDRRINLDNESTCDLTIADGCEYYFQSELSRLNLTYPSEEECPHFECWLLLKGSSGSGCKISFPNGTTFANGDEPEIGEGEDWEISIKDKIVVAIMNEAVE